MTPSILSAIKKLRLLLSREEKIMWFAIAGFALIVSLLEVFTASIVVIFAQVLNDPTVGLAYMKRVGIMQNFSSDKVVFYFAIGFGFSYLIKNIIAMVEVFFQNFSIQNMCYEFKSKLLNRYARADYGFYLTRNCSFGLQVISGDAEQSFSTGMVAIASVLSEGIIFFSLITMIIYMNPKLAIIIAIVGLVLSWLISNFLLPKFYYWGKKLQQTGIYTSQSLMQFLHAFKEILLLGKREVFVDAYNIYSKKRSRIQAVQTSTNALPRMGIEIIFVGMFVLTISYLCMRHESPIEMIGLLSGYLYVGFRLMPGLNRVINQLNVFKSVIPSVDRIYKEYTTIALGNNYIEIPDFHFDISIIFKNVTFRYLNTEKNVLSNVNLLIKKGECIGVVGETGSGKSTLIDLLLGLLRPSEGSILVDGEYPVNSYDWHKKIGYVPQSVYLIDDTIAANIAFGEREIDEDKLNRVIDIAQLRRFINSLLDGANTIVGERGIRLSGGERQRIAIARAIYHDPEVLIFDEATSALDNKTEAKVMESINSIGCGRTMIMIAHRLTTLKKCDWIITLTNGKAKMCDEKDFSKRNNLVLEND